MALFPINHTQPQGSLHYRLATLGYQRYNAFSVELKWYNNLRHFMH